jgi:hypothetical protein
VGAESLRLSLSLVNEEKIDQGNASMRSLL